MKKKLINILKKTLLWGGGLIAALIILVLLTVPAARLSSFAPDVPMVTDAHYFLTNVHLVPIAGTEPTGLQTLEIEAGRIKGITAFDPDQMPDGVVVDGQGGFLMPGLIDSHVHVFDRSDLPLFLGYGVTTVRNMMGMPIHLRWQQQSAAADFPGAHLITASPTFNAGDSYVPFHKMVENEAEARTLVGRFAIEGYDMIKLYDGLPENLVRAIADEAGKNNLRFAGHVPASMSFEAYLGLGPTSLEHIEDLFQGPLGYKPAPEKVAAMVAAIKASGTTVTPTLVAFHNIYRASEEKQAFVDSVPQELMTPMTRFFGERGMADVLAADNNDWETQEDAALMRITKVLYDAGVPLALGTDTGPAMTVPGLSVHDELALYEKLGIDRLDILRIATVNAAKSLGRTGEIGVVAVGASADLMLLADNPADTLKALSQPVMMIKAGTRFDETSIAALKAAGHDHVGLYVTVGQIIEHLLAY